MHDLVACDLCGRTILKGERIEVFVAGGDRRRVCELCTLQALRMGWSRESALADGSLDHERMRPRRPLWTRIVQWAEEQGLLGGSPAREGRMREEPAVRERAVPPPVASPPVVPAPTGDLDAGERPSPAPALPELEVRKTGEGPARERSTSAARHAEHAAGPLEAFDDTAADDGWAASSARRTGRTAAGGAFKDLLGVRRREPREIHAVPTSREGKLERAFELFNASEHRRTVAGIARTLGEPWISAAPVGDAAAAHEVNIVVAWELSWYRYRVDLDDVDQAVLLLARGDEIADLDESLRDWNAAADDAGCLALAAEPVS